MTDRFPAGLPSATIIIAMTRLTLAQKEILRLVASFRGLYGPLAIEAAMSALSQCPKMEWTPIVNHLEALESKGLIRLDESTGTPRFYITKQGERAAAE
jgi:hypothetical protein